MASRVLGVVVGVLFTATHLHADYPLPAFSPMLQHALLQHLRLPSSASPASCDRAPQAVTGRRAFAAEEPWGAAALGMRVKMQKARRVELGFQRWWDPDWRAMQTQNIKDPEAQFDTETLEMAKLMGVTPEELIKTMSNTAKVSLDTSEYDNLLLMCIKAAKAGDLAGMVQAREVLEKMDDVGIKPNVTAYNGVISACARAAGGKFRPCTVNDTLARNDLLDRATQMLNYAGGRMDTVEFSQKWREKYPNESLALWTRPTPNSTVPLSEIFRASPRFTVQRGNLPHSPNTILVKRKSGGSKTLAKKTPAGDGSINSWVSVGLEFLASMQRNKVSADSETYTALIGLCARAAAEEAAFNAGSGVQSTMMVDKAWELLAEMQARKLQVGISTYNALLSVCAGAGLQERAEEVLEMLRSNGLEPDAYTFTARMKLCASALEAEQLLEEMRERNLARGTAVYNTLLSLALSDARASRGPGGKARGAAGGSGASSSWEISRRVEAAMREEDVAQDGGTFTLHLAILTKEAQRVAMLRRMNAKGRSAGGGGDVTEDLSGQEVKEDALRLLREMEEYGGGGVLLPDVRAYTSVLQILAATASAQLRARAHEEGGEVAWGAATREAMALLSEMSDKGVKADARTFLAVLNVLSNDVRNRGDGPQAVAQARELMRLMKVQGIKMSADLWQAVLRVYVEAVGCKGGEKLLVECNRLLDRMREAGIQIDRGTYKLSLKAYVNSVSCGGPAKSHFERSMALIDRMEREGIAPDVGVYNLLILVAGRARIASGWKYKDKALNNGLRAFERLKGAGLTPTAETFQQLLTCTRTPEAVELVLRMVTGEGAELAPAHFETALLSLRANADGTRVEAAASLVRRAEDEGRVSASVYTAALAVYSTAGDVGAALGLLERLVAGRSPYVSAALYSRALTVCHKHGDKVKLAVLAEQVRAGPLLNPFLQRQLDSLEL